MVPAQPVATGLARLNRRRSDQRTTGFDQQHARGREFVPRGRLIASGCSSAWHAGRIDTVEGRVAKLELIFNQVNTGDRVLLPKDWQEQLPPGYAAGLRQKGASLACVDKIGMI